MSLPALPQWQWRNIIALIALLFTILGAAVLTLLAWWLLAGFADDADRLIVELVRDPHAPPEVGRVLVIIYEAMALGLKLLLGGVLVVLLSLGLAITPRRVRIDLNGAELSGGDEEVTQAVTRALDATAAATAAKSAELKGGG